jgi:membrane protein YqaA with SNARE-associated domain
MAGHTGAAQSGYGAVIGLSAYLGLFAVAFGAATVLPLQSEPVLAGLILSGEFSLAGLLLVASAGNVLGAVCNWVLGHSVDRFRDRAWFPVKAASLERAGRWYRRYGRWSLLLSWMPLFGDALTVLAGTLREPLWSFLLLVGVAKTGRYLALAAATLGTQAAIGL